MTALQQPPLAPPRDWSFPLPERARLSNGIETMVYRLPGQHVIAVHLILDIPLSVEDRAHEGVATISARTLDEGTRTHPGEEFAELLETEGAGFGIDASLAGLQAFLDVPASRLDRALRLFAEAVVEPDQADPDVRRQVALRLAEIEQARANSSHLAGTVFRAAVFDPDSRAARMSGGEPETVSALTPELVRSFHHDHFRSTGATLVMAGEFTADPLEVAEAALGSWQGPERPSPEQPTPGPADQQLILIDRPGAVQADVRLGGYGIDRRDPRWADISVASYAVGGAFLSRLNAVLREEKGYTYGIRMQFAPLRSGGSFSVQGSFRTDVVVDALVEARRLLDLTGKPITDREVADAVAFFTGVTPLRYATADGVADQVATQVLAGLDDDYVDQSLAALRVTTPESATAAYASLVDLDRLTLVVVGDADRIAEPLRAAGFAGLEVRSS